jgi:hypothetical protein|tara:strand:+ start:1429 stop:2145 length:717 start_codon:yes stop_codon:yes gene_type:complete
MKKELKIYTLRYFILIIIFFSLIKSTDFFKKIFFLNAYDYSQRISKNYSLCKKGSIPFLHFLKKKYKLKQKIKTIDYDINPSSDWVLFNLNNDNIYKDKLILLNYRRQEKIQLLKLKKGLFMSQKKPPHFFTIKKVIFSTNRNINKINIEISNRVEGQIEILLSKDFILKDQSKGIDLNFDLEQQDIGLGKLFIKISNKENNLKNIEEIKLIVIPNYDLDNFRILEKVYNCYFLERLS